eukprot:gb/GECH01006321.1/.p1 GENE.gb/GECH01006321.1/~~gb/GECH01006321.1/.p1  ORF type:complete len:623 (+),score=24.96 gb/GECH01006321.1/:1-1869(+)
MENNLSLHGIRRKDGYFVVCNPNKNFSRDVGNYARLCTNDKSKFVKPNSRKVFLTTFGLFVTAAKKNWVEVLNLFDEFLIGNVKINIRCDCSNKKPKKTMQTVKHRWKRNAKIQEKFTQIYGEEEFEDGVINFITSNKKGRKALKSLLQNPTAIIKDHENAIKKDLLEEIESYSGPLSKWLLSGLRLSHQQYEYLYTLMGYNDKPEKIIPPNLNCGIRFPRILKSINWVKERIDKPLVSEGECNGSLYVSRILNSKTRSAEAALEDLLQWYPWNSKEPNLIVGGDAFTANKKSFTQINLWTPASPNTISNHRPILIYEGKDDYNSIQAFSKNSFDQLYNLQEKLGLSLNIIGDLPFLQSVSGIEGCTSPINWCPWCHHNQYEDLLLEPGPLRVEPFYIGNMKLYPCQLKFDFLHCKEAMGRCAISFLKDAFHCNINVLQSVLESQQINVPLEDSFPSILGKEASKLFTSHCFSNISAAAEQCLDEHPFTTGSATHSLWENIETLIRICSSSNNLSPQQLNWMEQNLHSICTQIHRTFKRDSLYLHILSCHSLDVVEEYRSLALFSCEANEGKNKQLKKSIKGHTNGHRTSPNYITQTFSADQHLFKLNTETFGFGPRPHRQH